MENYMYSFVYVYYFNFWTSQQIFLILFKFLPN
jgi:hypothetical protein